MLAHLVNKMWNRNFKKWNSRRIQRNRKKVYPGEGSVLGSFLLLNRLLQQTQPREKGVVLACGLRARAIPMGKWRQQQAAAAGHFLSTMRTQQWFRPLLFSLLAPCTVPDLRQGMAPPTESRSFPHLWRRWRWSPKAFPESHFPGDSRFCQVDS